MENFNDTNIWRDVAGYEGYYKVSRDGRIYSIPRRVIGKNGASYPVEGGIVAQHITRGYAAVNLCKGLSKKVVKVHRLVGLAFIPNLENKPCINHINGIKNDNRVENLEWTTFAENTKHAIDTGLINTKGRNYSKGERHRAAKLTEKEILEIRKLYKTGEFNQRQLAKKFNISFSVMSTIVNNKIWTHI